MVLQWPTDGAEAQARSRNSWSSMRPAASSSRAFQIVGAGAGAHALPPAVQHRPAGEHDRRDVHRRRRHDQRRRGLVAAGQQHHAVERIAVQHLDQAEIGEVPVERRGRPLAGLLDRVAGEFERHAAGVADAVAHALGQIQVMAVAWRQVGAGLRDADDRLAGAKLRSGQAVVEIALEIERRHAGVVRIVEPELRAQVFAARGQGFRFFCHGRPRPSEGYFARGCAERRRARKTDRPKTGESRPPSRRFDFASAMRSIAWDEGRAAIMLNQLLSGGLVSLVNFGIHALMTGIIVVATHHIAAATDELHVFVRVTA